MRSAQWRRSNQLTAAQPSSTHLKKRLATEHPQFEDTGKAEPDSSAPSTESGEGLLLSNFTLVRLGAVQKAAEDPAKRELLAKRGGIGANRRNTLKYQKAADSPRKTTKGS